MSGTSRGRVVSLLIDGYMTNKLAIHGVIIHERYSQINKSDKGPIYDDVQ